MPSTAWGSRPTAPGSSSLPAIDARSAACANMPTRTCDPATSALRLAATSVRSRTMKAALLPDRGVVKVAGDDARKFLNGLVTSDIAKVTPAAAGFGRLLRPHGKINADFTRAEAPPADGGGFFLDCPRALASSLVQRLNFYKLRAKLVVEDLSETLGVLAIWDGGAESEYGLCCRDPRLAALGLRCM